MPTAAQRRPGREPRRHLSALFPISSAEPTLNEGRGVNPGDTQSFSTWGDMVDGAQRRPGREPRRHGFNGARCPRLNAALNEGRGVNPGDTRAGDIGDGWTLIALNEGRGVNPGDTGRA